MDTLIGIKRIFEKIHHAMLKSDDFTIISNNCWGGTVYRIKVTGIFINGLVQVPGITFMSQGGKNDKRRGGSLRRS